MNKEDCLTGKSVQGDEKIKMMSETAIHMRKKSYAPYSGFRVGAALLTKKGKIYTGCNVENAAFTPTCCAERTAVFKAVSEGDMEFEAIAVAGGGGFCPPCGVCRQVLREFCSSDFPVVLVAESGETKIIRLGELLPESFGPDFFNNCKIRDNMNGVMKTMNYRRIFLIVIDSFGIGEAADAARFGDAGADTFGHIWESTGGIHIPHLESMGLFELSETVAGSRHPQNGVKIGKYFRMAEKSAGKDTMTGHWEMMGLEVKEPFLTFSENGFPPELIKELERRCGRKIVGNKSVSGTVILDELGEEEINNHALIVYTSADSVMQICGNEETMGLETLYRYCEIARKLTMKEEWKVGRVIARPYVGRKKGEFVRTSNRHDYAVEPIGPTVMDALKENKYDVISVGKIQDIFSGKGITKAYHSESSVHGMEQTIAICGEDFCGLCFTNLVDFDALWGHRRDPAGYGRELEKFDEKLGEFLPLMREDDLLLITADHGNDPTFKGTDHTREYVPLLAYSPSMKTSGRLSDADTFAQIGATVADNFGVDMPAGTIGRSRLADLE